MTLVDALNLGRPFKRKKDHEWYIYDYEYNGGWFYYSETPQVRSTFEDIGTSIDLYFEDIMAKDWETLDV